MAARIAGFVLILVFVGLSSSSNGLDITFRFFQTSSSVGELNFWLGSVVLLCPAALFIGYGFTERIDAVLAYASRRARAMDVRERRLALLVLAVLIVAAARIGHAGVLLDLPITDDEYAVDFGGRVLASGHVLAHLPLPQTALPSLFLYFRNGAVGSFDWIGGQAVAAFASLTHLGPFAWGILAAVPAVAVALLAGERLGTEWGGAAIGLFLGSPMAALLSITTHAALASRAFLALGVYALWRASERGGALRWGMTGAAFGATFLCRPPETVFFCAPIGAWILWRSLRGDPKYRAAIPSIAAAGGMCAAIFFWHAYAMTGHPLLPARFAVPENTDVLAVSFWSRFGDNVSYNVYMLAIWFLGPLGVLLFAAGVRTDSFTRVIGWAVAADLCLTFFHDNPGLHIVGPIHYSETAMPLTIVATHGAANLIAWARRHALDARVIAASIAAVLVVELGTVTAVQAAALHRQAGVQYEVYDAIERAVGQPNAPKAVIFTPWLFSVVNAVPALRETGTWVHDWRRPQLDLSDAVLYLRNDPAIEQPVRAVLPDRRFFRLETDAESRWLVLRPLNGGPAIRLTRLGPLRP